MPHVGDYRAYEFGAEVALLFQGKAFNFGNTEPVDVVKEALLKSVCGWHNGSAAQSIIVRLGYVEKHNKADELTAKGQAFLWWAFGRQLPTIQAIGRNAELHNEHE